VGGRLEQGLDYDVVFNEPMNRELMAASDDIAVRRALLYQYINSRLLPYLDKDNVFVVRYERWFSDPDRLRREISRFLEVPFAESNVAIREEPRRQEAAAVIDLVREHVPVRLDLGYDV